MCDTMVSFWVPKGYDYREHKVKCGNTDPWGGAALCEKCSKDSAVLRHHANVDDDNEMARYIGIGEY
jgi:hypothetical protein|tara:strand:+ start:207 stop:407 length:201 start_codon:yes stop_codon:yes gene_type:complete